LKHDIGQLAVGRLSVSQLMVPNNWQLYRVIQSTHILTPLK